MRRRTDDAPAAEVPTREGYDRWAEFYDGDGNPLVALEEPHVARMLGDVCGLALADIGTGTGRHAIALAQQGARVVAIDFSMGMLAKACAKADAQRVRFVCADCSTTLPLRTASFDRVLTCLLADHVPSLDGFIAELARICRPDGFIVLTTVHPAMHLLGTRARFTDPATGHKVYPRSYEFAMADYVMAAQRAGLHFDELGEWICDKTLEASVPRAARYAGWPMLLTMRLSRRREELSAGPRSEPPPRSFAARELTCRR
jgi:ubiquinone/menaquinone biosynthesis C-methylase UbiE